MTENDQACNFLDDNDRELHMQNRNKTFKNGKINENKEKTKLEIKLHI